LGGIGVEGKLELSVWEHVPAFEVLEIRFVLKNPDTSREIGVIPQLEVVVSSNTYTTSLVEMQKQDMKSLGVLVANETAKWSTKRIGQNTEAFNSLNHVTITLRPSAVLPAGSKITISGLNSSQPGSSLVVRG
jgi:hypothetical protein